MLLANERREREREKLTDIMGEIERKKDRKK